MPSYIGPAELVLIPFLAVIPAKIAQRKSRNFWSWYWPALLFWPGALVAALVIRKQRVEPSNSLGHQQEFRSGDATEATKRCPDCAEIVLDAARTCKHCGYRWPSTGESEEVMLPGAGFIDGRERP
jgi:hypothetical protein